MNIKMITTAAKSPTMYFQIDFKITSLSWFYFKLSQGFANRHFPLTTFYLNTT